MLTYNEWIKIKESLQQQQQQQQQLPGIQQYKDQEDRNAAITGVINRYKQLIRYEIKWHQQWQKGKRGKPVYTDIKQFQKFMAMNFQYSKPDQGIDPELWNQAHEFLEQECQLWDKLWIMYQKAIQKVGLKPGQG